MKGEARVYRIQLLRVEARVWVWVFLLISFATGFGAAQVAGSLRKDFEALREFKMSMTEDPKGVLNGWKLKGHGGSDSPCSWHGIKCSENRVSELDLSNAGLSGTFWFEKLISGMDMLNVLVLRGNSLSWVLNGRVKNGCSLSILDLSENNQSGKLPVGLLSSCANLISVNMSWNSLTGVEDGPLAPKLQTLDLSHNLFQGSGLLSVILASCENLQHLDLSCNKLNGSIPPGISSCTQLVSLNLSANFFQDRIPTDLLKNAQCNSKPHCSAQSSIQYLDLSNNNISGPLSALFSEHDCPPKLTVLNLSSNNIINTIPDSLGTCKGLKLLNLSNNRLSGNIPASIGGLKSIENLVLSGNDLKGNIPPEIVNTCPTLSSLNLSFNKLTGSLPSTFTSCSLLQVFDLSHNQLIGSFLNDLLGSLQSLKVLQLSFNNLTGSIPLSLTNSSGLEVLDLSANRLSGRIPPGIFSPASSLRKLFLPNNQLTGPLPVEVAKWQNLQTLDLSFNFLNGSIPAVLGSLPNLRDLILWLNYFEGEIPDSICDSGSLETLILNDNHLTGSIPESLAKCSNLIWISLSSNRLHGQIPATLGKLAKLAILQLDNNSLSGPIPPELGNCSSLIWLDLNSNMLNGTIPAALAMQSGHIVAGGVSGKLFAFIRNEGGTACRGAGGLLEFAGIRPEQLMNTPMLLSCEYTRVYLGTTVYRFEGNGTLIYLDLSYNSLYGTIPESFGSLHYIEVFTISHNQISGTIPTTLGDMKEAGLLDLSHNNLQGVIPGSLGGLSFLTELDVSYNNLSGLIPSSGQLMTFPPSKYEHNSGLCGLPLPPCGSNDPSSTDYSHASSPGSNHRGRAVVSGISLGIFIAMVCVVGLIVIAVRIRKEKKQEERRDRYMDSLPTSGSGSWKLSGVLEPLSINVATFEKPLRKLTFAHLLEATNGFSADSLIGSGGFGDVYKAQLKDGTVVAIKKLIHVSGQGDREFTAEMETIGKIKHRNLVPLLGYCKVGEERLLVYEYMKWGSLETVLHEKLKGSGTLDWPARKKIAIGSARGLAFLHHSCIPHIIHRDMKSSNVLLDENMEPRVSDFGMARLMNASDTHLSVSSLAGTPGYVPPEYYQSFRCTTKGDVYSYGVILLELLSGRRPIDPEVFGDTNLVGWMKQNVKLKKTSEVFDPVLKKDKNIEMDLYNHLRIACECLDDRWWRRPTMIQVMAMFRELHADGEVDPDMFSLPEDADVDVAEESLP